MMPLPMAGKTTAETVDARLLARTRVATPCRAEWAQMVGDDKSRYCGSCKKNVYNLSAMTGKEAAALIREKEGNLCIRYYQRADGTVMTQDCPVGVAAVKRKIARAVAASIVGFATVFSVATQWWQTDNGTNVFVERFHIWAERIHPERATAAAMASFPLETPAPVETPMAVMGKPMMGEIAPAPREVLGRGIVGR